MKLYASLFLLLISFTFSASAQTVRVIKPVTEADTKADLLTQKLGLNVQQQAQVNQVLTATGREMESIKGLEHTAPPIYNQRKNAILTSMDAKLRAILTPAQLAQYNNWQAASTRAATKTPTRAVASSPRVTVKPPTPSTKTAKPTRTKAPAASIVQSEPEEAIEEEEVYEEKAESVEGSGSSQGDDILMKSVDFLFHEILRPALQKKKKKK